MKFKYFITFIFILCVFLFSYYLLITHIDIFITNYDEKLLTFDIKEEIKNNDNIISKILSGKVDMATEKDIEPILENEFIINLISGISDISQEEIKLTIRKMAIENHINIIEHPAFDSKIIYMSINENLFTFTLDTKNIYYSKGLSGESCIYETSNNDYDKVYSSINSFAKKYQLKEKFNFEISSIEFADGSEYSATFNLVYFIEDSKNNINIIYSLSCNTPYSVQIGFNF